VRPAALLLGLALAASPVAAEVVVRVSGDKVDLTATAAPLADVLDRLARQTGMKVFYEGPAPRQLVSLSLHGRTPAETVLALFEGLGINFALVADASGARVQTLMVAGAAAASSSASPSARPAPVVTPRRPFGPPPGSSPDAAEPAFDEGEDEPMADDEESAAVPPGTEPATEADGPNGGGQASPPGTAPFPTRPTTTSPFSPSPFMPQPQPFPPLPPGAPAGTSNPPPEAIPPTIPPQQ
jgi:hypothetical protein